MKNNDKFWLAFASIEEVGAVFIKRLYDHFGCIENAWTISVSELAKVENITKKQVSYFLEKRKNVNPDECFEYIAKKGISYLNYEDGKYPKLLKEIYNPPMTLFYKGDIEECNLTKTLAVVGSRRASQSAKQVLSEIISEFNGSDLCIVSGLALGIDTVAHSAALAANLKTIGVIASGFDYCYPASNKELYRKIENGHGVVVSEYWPTFEPLSWRFPQRNRIVSGLSYGTLIAEAAIKSGAIITANLTLEQGRELMCMPGNISNPNTQGIYKLLKQGATLVTCADDILNALNWDLPTIKGKIDENLGLSKDEKDIFDAISIEPKTFDELSLTLKIEFAHLMTILTTLELKGIIKQIDGERYMSCKNT